MSETLSSELLSIPAPLKAVILETRVVTGKGGGPEKTILNTPRYMNSFGFRTLCAYMYPPGDEGFKLLQQRADFLNCPLFGVEDRGVFDWNVVRQLLQICRKNQVTFWHGHDYKSNFLGLYLRRYYPMKLITTVHGWVHHTWKTPIYYALDRWCLKHYDHVICVSRDLYERCLDMKISEEQCSLVYNGIDMNQYRRTMSCENAKKRLGFPKQRFIIGAAGRLSPEKNFAGLIRVTAKLIKEGLPLSLYIAGEGELHESLQKLIFSLKMHGEIHLLGFCNNIMEFYQGLDLFILNSLREGLPNVVLEAMALEVPVISTRVAGMPDLITNGYDGVLVSPGNDNELEEVLRNLYRETEYREMLGLNGNYTIDQRFQFSDRMKKIRNIYQKILEKDDPTLAQRYDPWECSE